jgi:hypothetical protein
LVAYQIEGGDVMSKRGNNLFFSKEEIAQIFRGLNARQKIVMGVMLR